LKQFEIFSERAYWDQEKLFDAKNQRGKIPRNHPFKQRSESCLWLEVFPHALIFLKTFDKYYGAISLEKKFFPMDQSFGVFGLLLMPTFIFNKYIFLLY
jgi:hypothetical protein